MIKKPPASVYAAAYEPSPGRAGYVVIQRLGYRRMNAPSDWLVERATSTRSPNTLKSQAESVAQWWSWCVDKEIDPLATTAVEFAHFVAAMQATPKIYSLSSPVRALPGDSRLREATTVRLRVVQIQSFYKWAGINGRSSSATAKGICAYRPPRAADRARASRLLPSQMSALLEAQHHPRERFGIELLYGGGLREGEAVGLRIEDLCVNREVAEVFRCTIPPGLGPHLHVRHRLNANGAFAKSPFERVVPIAPRVMVAYRNWQAWTYEHLPEAVDCPFVFVSLSGRTRGAPLSLSGFNSRWQKRVKSVLGLEQVTPHLLRHTFASELADTGVDSFVIQTLLGHRSPKSTQVYTHALNASLINAVQQLAAWRATTIGLAA